MVTYLPNPNFLSIQVSIKLPFNELRKLDPDRVSHLPDPDGLEHAGVPELVQHDNVLKVHWSFAGIGFDAANKVRITPGCEKFGLQLDVI